jgi:hypothetical protein
MIVSTPGQAGSRQAISLTEMLTPWMSPIAACAHPRIRETASGSIRCGRKTLSQARQPVVSLCITRAG